MKFPNPLKGLFKSAKDKLQQAETRTFVRFFTDAGAKFAEVKDRDVSKLTLPEGTHHFKFFDRVMKKDEEPNTMTLFTDAQNVSPTHYVVDAVLTLAAYKAMLETDAKEKLSSPVNPEAVMPGAFVAIADGETRTLSPEENNIVAIDRKTLKQLWPAVETGPHSTLSHAPRR